MKEIESPFTLEIKYQKILDEKDKTIIQLRSEIAEYRKTIKAIKEIIRDEKTKRADK